VPATLLGRVMGKRLLRQAGEIIGRLAHEAVGFLKGSRETMFDFTPPTPVTPAARERIEAAVQELENGPYAHGLARKLADEVLNELDADVGRLRPIRLARLWNVPVRQVVELCLAAVRAGLLGMRWDLLCTSCRGPKLSVATLDQLPTGAHCASCNIDYERNFTRNVELVFFPNAAIRPINAGGYCLSGPMTTPHVLAQQIMAAGETRALEMDLPPGPYRVRALTGVEALDFEHAGGVFPDIVATETGFATQPGAARGKVNFVNRRAGETILLLESRAWVADALTAHRATMFQAFRDLFAQATLRPGDEAGIDRVTLMFSDLKGSTELYERLGDAAAYNLVREHFAYLGAIQRRIGEFNARYQAQGGVAEAIVVKLGIHRGACIVVNLNERLDYFGSAVNLAARLQGQSRGADLVLSTDLAEDPEVAKLLAELPHAEESASLRGFAREIPFKRVSFA
jgi:class 3 adenylate cyclase